jgi:hypothetical protein
MFERYTEKARRVIFFSRYEASQVGSPYIETQHLLLGLMREDKRLVNLFLHSHEWVESIRREIEGLTPVREKTSTSVDLPLSSECKIILAYAAEEADRVSDHEIGTGHLLLGILREEKSPTAQLLNQRGVNLEIAREKIREYPKEPLATPPKSPGLPAGYFGNTLLYNRPSETLILELHSIASRMQLPPRIFIRQKGEEAYEVIGNPGQDVSYESPVTCEKHPVVVFNSMKLDGRGRGRNWDGVLSFNLETRILEKRISTDTLRFPEPHGRLWVSELVSLSEDAGTVCVRIGIEKEVTGGRVVHYYLAEIGFSDQEVKLLSRLLDARF